jgi:tetratricopeptide (TPR) repeat protein
MKAERRHDLRTNELAEWLGHFPEFWRENYRMVIYVTVVLIIVAVAVYFKWYRERIDLMRNRSEVTEYIARVAQSKIDTILGVRQGVDFSNRLLEVADALDTASASVDDPVSSALALCKRAEALRAELHYRPYSLEPQAVKIQVNQAVKCYEKALVKARGNAGIEAMAKLGLGLSAEELGDSAKAKDVYREIVDNPDYQGSVFVSQAEKRLEEIEEYSGEVYFAKTAAPAQAESEQFDVLLSPEVTRALVGPPIPTTYDLNEILR